MGTIIILVLVMVAFDLAALRWGYNTTESINSPEWEKRWHSQSLE